MTTAIASLICATLLGIVIVSCVAELLSSYQRMGLLGPKRAVGHLRRRRQSLPALISRLSLALPASSKAAALTPGNAALRPPSAPPLQWRGPLRRGPRRSGGRV